MVNLQHLARSLLGGIIDRHHPVGSLDPGPQVVEAAVIPAPHVYGRDVMTAAPHPHRNAINGCLHVLDTNVEQMDGESVVPRILHQAQDGRSSECCLDREALTAPQELALEPECLTRRLSRRPIGRIGPQSAGNRVGIENWDTGRHA